MRRFAIIGLWLAGLGGLGLLWWPRSPARSSERSAARAVVDRLEGYVEERAALVRELADRFGTWESLPEAALASSLASAAKRHPGLGRLLVADTAGRLLAGYDSDRRLGDERLGRGSLDPVLSRREALGRSESVVVQPSAQAGVLQSVELAAPIRRADGSTPGYVGATVHLGPLHRLLEGYAREGLGLRVTTARGELLYPCSGGAKGEGRPVRSTRFVAWIEPAPGRAGKRIGLPLLVSLLLLAALLLATRALSRLDSLREIRKSDREPPSGVAGPRGQAE